MPEGASILGFLPNIACKTIYKNIYSRKKWSSFAPRQLNRIRAHLFDLTADRHFDEGQARDAAELRPCWRTIGIISSFLRRLSQKLPLSALPSSTGIDPELHLRTVLAPIANHPVDLICDLLPWNLAVSLQSASQAA